MSLLDEARAYAAPKATCSVPGVLASLSEDDAADLRAALADLTITSSAIERALSNRGVHLRASTMRRHRTRGCLCAP
jgi:hypothetical protein